MPDVDISKPSYYTRGNIEVVDFILDQGLDMPLGSAVKYICRAGYKSEEGMEQNEKTIQDLKKAMIFIQFKIDYLEGRRRYTKN